MCWFIFKCLPGIYNNVSIVVAVGIQSIVSIKHLIIQSSFISTSFMYLSLTLWFCLTDLLEVVLLFLKTVQMVWIKWIYFSVYLKDVHHIHTHTHAQDCVRLAQQFAHLESMNDW